MAARARDRERRLEAVALEKRSRARARSARTRTCRDAAALPSDRLRCSPQARLRPASAASRSFGFRAEPFPEVEQRASRFAQRRHRRFGHPVAAFGPAAAFRRGLGLKRREEAFLLEAIQRHVHGPARDAPLRARRQLVIHGDAVRVAFFSGTQHGEKDHLLELAERRHVGGHGGSIATMLYKSRPEGARLRSRKRPTSATMPPTEPPMRKLLFTALAMVLVGVALPAQTARRFTLDDFSRVARVADPQFAPDGKSIAVVVSHPNLDEDRYDPELTVVDVPTKTSHTIVKGLTGLNFERWSPDGTKFAFLANAGPAGAQHLQVFVVSAKSSAAPKQMTTNPRGVQQLAWSPDSKTIAYAAQDDPEQKPGFEKWNRSFEVTVNTNLTMTEPEWPTHLWIVPAAGGEPKRMTSGNWSMPMSHPPGTPSSAIVWTPDGTGIVITRGPSRVAASTPAPAPTPNGATTAQPAPGQRGGAGQGGFGGGGLQVVKLSDGSMTPLGGGGGSHPQFSPDGKMIVTNNGAVFTIGVAPMAQAPGANVAGAAPAGAGAQAGGGRGANGAGRGGGGGRGGGNGPASSLDISIQRGLWMPDGKSIIVGGNDAERVSLWQASLGGGDPAKLDTHGVSPNSSFFVDMAINKDGAIAFTGTTPMHPAELWYMASTTSAPVQLTTVNDAIAAIPLGKSEVITWKNDNFNENGIVTYPPDFNPSQKYPLVLYIHGGPAAASMMTFSAAVQLYAAQGDR